MMQDRKEKIMAVKLLRKWKEMEFSAQWKDCPKLGKDPPIVTEDYRCG